MGSKFVSAGLRISRFRHGAGGADEGGALNNSMADIALRAVNHRTQVGSRAEANRKGARGTCLFLKLYARS